MPSPIVHLSVGAITYFILRKKGALDFCPGWKSRMACLGGCLFAALLPDIDTLPGFATGNLGKYHNQATHSLIAAPVAAILAWVLFRLAGFARVRAVTLLVFASYLIHLALDYVTHGRGLKLFWPWLDERFMSPVLIFFGLKWSDGLISSRHWITAFNEISVVVCSLGIGWLLVKWMNLRTSRGGAA